MVTKVDSGLIVHDGGTIKDALDKAKPIADYVALRAYTGSATQVRITNPGIAGFFYYDATDTSSADNGGTIIVTSNGKRWKRLYESAIDVKWFGATGLYPANDTSSINLAILYASSLGGGTVSFSPGIYGVSATGVYDGVQLKTGVYLDLNGAKLKAIPANSPSYRLINIEQASNCGIGGGEIEGDRASNSAIGEHGHCVNIILDCINVTIRDLKLRNAFGDGLYIGRQCSDINVVNCHITNNRRNNVSVVTASNVVIDACEISYANGTLPECGIDIEPNVGDAVSTNVTITNCQIYGNNKDGIAFSAPPPTPLIESAFISNCNIYSNGRYGVLASYVKFLEISNSVVRNNGSHGIADSAALATLLMFNGNIVKNNGGDGINGFSSNTIIEANQITNNTGWGINWKYGQQSIISNNYISDSGQDGIIYERAYNCTISGNTIKNSQKHGIFITGTSTSSVTRSRKVTVTGNTITSSSLLADNTYSGIYFDQYANTSIITANTVSAGTTGNLPLYAIFAADSTVFASNNQTTGGAKSGNSEISIGSVAPASFIPSPNILSHTYAPRYYLPGLCYKTSGVGSPEGAVGAPVGSTYTRTDGAAGTTLYVKETGTGNTGWVAK